MDIHEDKQFLEVLVKALVDNPDSVNINRTVDEMGVLLTLDVHADFFKRMTPLGKLGGDEDLKGAAILFASDAGGHITGQCLVVDGGAIVV